MDGWMAALVCQFWLLIGRWVSLVVWFPLSHKSKSRSLTLLFSCLIDNFVLHYNLFVLVWPVSHII